MYSNIALIAAFAATALAAPLSVAGRVDAPNQARQLDALTGLLGGATGTGSAAGASSSGAAGGAGGLDALVGDAPLDAVFQQDGHEHILISGNSDWPSWRCHRHGQRCRRVFIWSGGWCRGPRCPGMSSSSFYVSARIVRSENMLTCSHRPVFLEVLAALAAARKTASVPLLVVAWMVVSGQLGPPSRQSNRS